MTQLNFLWQSANVIPILPHDQVHIWCASLEQSPDKVQALAQTLSADEQSRASRFRFRQHQENFIISRGFLREILSRYLHTQAVDLQFCYSPNGKPSLANIAEGNRLSFNLSHSGKIVLYAMNWNHEIGIDIEEVKAIPDLDGLVKNFFSEPEKQAILELEPDEKIVAFFNGWTRKEAYLKAVGTGLSLFPAHVEVSLNSDENPRFIKISGDTEAAEKWILKTLVPVEGYVGAIALPKQDWHFQYRQWVG
jgi:4'-phosphopantetheinyl transferase